MIYDCEGDQLELLPLETPAVYALEGVFDWNISRISEGFRADRGTVRRKLRQACVEPARVRNGIPLYALSEAIPALYRATPEPPPEPEEMSPADLHNYYRSENSRLKFEREQRHLVPDAEARAERDKLTSAIAGGLDRLPALLADALSDSPGALDLVGRRVAEMKANMPEGD